ncbi:MAG: type II toxin-antitoxin system HicA family toxin [Deltaproteobacteria bacterium]|nr:type II toxin-antitoxin system HicA family toxin [Deltaproteobacteria bacterium]
MGKLRVLSGKEVCSVLERYGFIEVRRRGSHIVMQKKLSQGTITVPVPNHHEIRIGTLQSIIRQSGLPKYEFETLKHKYILTPNNSV